MNGRRAQMQLDFHYYATYCAAQLAGFDHEESQLIAYCSQFTDCCTETLLKKIGAPGEAATTQLQVELADSGSDILSLQKITRIWASFHFLPRDLKATRARCGKSFLAKYRLICGPNGELLADTVELARGKGIEAAGLAMHILADTWAHMYFAGTPSLAINNTNYYFYEIVPDGSGFSERQVKFNHNPSSADDLEKGSYTNSLYQGTENSVMNLGHGRAGHFPDYSFARYRYMPSWGEYREIVKDNPSDYLQAFTQMIYALKYLRGTNPVFETGRYDAIAADPWMDEILRILRTRQLDSSADWKALGEKISGCSIEDFDQNKYLKEYTDAPKDSRDNTVLGRYILAALAQKSMVTNRIYRSGSRLAGISVDFTGEGQKIMRDFGALIRRAQSDD